MPASKRKAEASGSRTRPPKVAKTAGSKNAKKAKLEMSAPSFKKRAKPLHVVVTQPDNGAVEEFDLVPTSFSTGSYGWKGSKRVVVEFPAMVREEKTDVQVTLTVNATIIGSKSGKGTEESGEIEASSERE
ncbi:hypothetical protein APHAL10511_007127 [Amanita phalloides]|nr:hypothetical protein APHAL10511_007127 [Amanita phalloides]